MTDFKNNKSDIAKTSTERWVNNVLKAKRMSEELAKLGLTVVSYEESKDPKFMDGAVTLENSLSVQVGSDYACLCLIQDDEIDYLLEAEEIKTEAVFASEVAKFLQTWRP